MSFQDLLDPQKIIQIFGLIGVILIIFAESGLFFGFFFPGDSLLFTAGFLASQGYLPIYILVIGVFLASVLGDNVGYWFGKKTGPKLFIKEDSIFFKKVYIQKANLFYEEHGKKTIIIARFIPIVRTFVPIIAGMANMNYKHFVTYNILGGALWSIGLTLFGYFLGKTIPGVDKYLLPIILGIIIISFLPTVGHLFKKKDK